MLKVDIDGHAINNIEFSGSGRELIESLCTTTPRTEKSR